MKLLVFGAGVLGCNLANNLFRAGKDVTLLARGPWAEEIRSNGLRIKNTLSRRTAVNRIPVAEELSPEDAYDVIFVAVRYTQIETILETLRASRAKTIIFVGNNVRASETAAYLPEKNVLFAFTSAAGHEILPDADKEFEGAAWTRKRIPIFSLDLSVCGRNIRGRVICARC